MKRRLLLLVLLALFGVLSACASADMEPIDEGEPTFDASIRFEWDTLRFHTGGENDILYGIGSIQTDVMLVRARSGLEPLTDTQETTYLELLETFAILQETTAFRYEDIASYRLSMFSEFVTEAGLELDVAIVFTFQQFQEDRKTMHSTYATIVGKDTYIGHLLGRNLTDVEYDHLILFQDLHNEATMNGPAFSFVDATYAMWEEWMQAALNHSLTDTEKAELAHVFDFLQALRQHNQ